VEHVAHVIQSSGQKPEEMRPLERDRYRWEQILWKQGGKVWIGCIWLRTGTDGVRSHEHSNEPLGSIKG
jgi:hypothetical protein